MPFLTEELWQSLKRSLSSDWRASESIMVAPYPEADAKAVDPDAERVMESIIEIVRSIRNARAEHNVENVRWIEAQIYGGKLTTAITPYSQAIETLSRARPVTIHETKGSTPENSLVLVLKETEVVIPMESMVDLEAEKRRLEKEIEQSQAEVARLEARLKDANFLSRAPAAVIEKERQKCYALTDKLGRLQQEILKY
jgi:valyl-tRNA synthetase